MRTKASTAALDLIDSEGLFFTSSANRATRLAVLSAVFFYFRDSILRPDISADSASPDNSSKHPWQVRWLFPTEDRGR